MPFQTNLLGWKASGVEPPDSLKERGWEAQQKPPAPYFNWFFHLIDQALSDLQKNAIHKEVIGKAGGLAKLDANGKVLNADGTNAGEVTKIQFEDHTKKAATVMQAGHVQLSDAHTSNDTTKAATSNAVKKAYDRADAAFQSASNGKTAIKNAVTGVDSSVVIPANPTFQQLATAVGQINTGKRWASGTSRSGAANEYMSGTFAASNLASITVYGLNFAPQFIFVVDKVFGVVTTIRTPYTSNYRVDNVFKVLVNLNTSSGVFQNGLETSPWGPSSEGFKMPVAKATTQYDWIAME